MPSKFFYGWAIALVSFLTYFSTMGPRGAFGNLVQPWNKQFGWDLQQISFAASLSIFLFGFSQPVVGWLVTRLGPRKVVLGGLITYGISSFLLSFINSLWQLYLLYGVVMGISWAASGGIPLSTMLSSWFYKKRGLVLSMSLSGMAIGQFLLIPLSMFIILNWGWRWAMALLSLLILGMALPLVFKIVRNTPAEMGLLPDGAKKDSSASASYSGARKALDPSLHKSIGLKAAMRTSSFWLLVGSFFVCGLTAHLLGVHFVPSAISSGYHPLTAATAAGLMGAATTIGLWISGFLSDTIGRKIPLATLYLLRGLGLIMLLFSSNQPTLYMAALLTGLGILGTSPLTQGLVADLYGVATMGTILGIISMAHQIGGGLSIYLAGHIAHSSGSYYWAFLPAAFFLFAASLSCLFIQEKRPQPTEIPHPAMERT